VERSWFGVWGMMGRSEVWRWSSITWSCPRGMKDRKVIAVMAAWWCHRGEIRGRVVEWRVSFSISF